MAKTIETNIFAHTEQKQRIQERPTEAPRPKPLGVSLSAEDVNRLDEIAAEVGRNRHFVMQYACRYFVEHWPEIREKETERSITLRILR